MAEKTSIKMDQDIIIPSCGFRAAGTVVTKEEAGDSYEWLLKNEKGQLVSDNVSVVPADPAILTAPKGKTAVQVDPAGTDATETDTEDEGELAEGDEGSVTSEETPVVSEDDAAVIGTVKELLAQGKMHLKTIVQQTGFTEDVVSPLLTEVNGFRKNQQGWFSNI
jgi:hypothetical protein